VLETIITEVLEKKDKLFVTFRNLGSVHIDWQHIFSSKILSHDEANILEKDLYTSKIYDQIQFRRLKRPFNIVQIKAPIHLKKQLPEKIILGHYKEQMWNYFSLPGSVASINENLFQILLKRKEFEQELQEIRKEIIQLFPDSGKSHQSAIFNKLNQLYFEKRIHEIPANRYTKKLNVEILEKRENAQETYSKLEKIANLIHIKTGYNKKNQSIDLNLPSTDLINVHGPLNYEKNLQQKWLFLDIEIPHFDREKPEISWVGLSYYQNGNLNKEIHTLSSLKEKNVNDYLIFTHDSEINLVKAVKESILKENPYYVSAYNAKFDLMKLREVDFKIGERETNPIKEVSTKFFERIGIRGREVIDLLRWAQTCFDYLPNQKLETVAKEVLGPETFSKSISYQEMAELEDFARSNNPIKKKSAKKIASYLASDVDIMVDLFESKQFQYFLKDMSIFSNSFHIPLSQLIYSSKKIQVSQDRSYFHETGIHYNEVYRKTKFNQNKRQKTKRNFNRRLNNLFEIQKETGLYENVHQCYLPQGFFLKNIILRKLPQANSLFSMESENNFRRFYLSKFANSLAERILIDYENYKHQEIFDNKDEIKKAKFRIKGKYNSTVEEIETNMNRMKKVIENWVIKNDLNIIHQEGNHLYLQGGNEETYQRSNLSPVIKVCSLERVLLTKERIFFKRNGIIKNQKKLSQPNNFTNLFEMETYSELLDNLLQGNLQESLEELYFNCDTLLSKKVNPEKLIWKNKTKGFYSVFSEGSRINFFPSYEGEIKTDINGNYVESEDHKIYLLNINQANIDWNKYFIRNEEKVKEFLFPLIGEEYLKFTRPMEEIGFLTEEEFKIMIRKIKVHTI